MTKRRVSGKQRLELIQEQLGRVIANEINEAQFVDEVANILTAKLEPKHKNVEEADLPF